MTPFEQVSLAVFNASSLLEAALAYARAGIPIFPLRPGNKQPLVPRGFYSATTDLQRILQWWHTTPQANIGVACGTPSGWWVLDVDPRHGGWESLAQLQADIDQGTPATSGSSLLYGTRRQLTGGDGVHLLFRKRSDLPVTLSSMPNFAGYQGLDYKGDRSYVVVAPSIHPSGNRYQWLTDQPLLPFPNALVVRWVAHRQHAFAMPLRSQLNRNQPEQRVNRPEQHRAGPQDYLRYALSQALPGQRNRYACYLACSLVDEVGLSWEQAVPWMCEFVACVSQANHPYTEREALSALHWAIFTRIRPP